MASPYARNPKTLMTEHTKSIPSQNSLRYIVGVFYFAFRVLVGSYALSILGALLIHFFISEDTSDIAGLVNSILYFMMIGTLLLFPITVLLRRRDLAFMLLPSVIIWLIWTIPTYLPKSAPIAPQNAQELTILTYNVWANNPDRGDVIRIIQEANADIVVVQELSFDVSDAIEIDLKDLYPYMQLKPAGIPGMGILSKYPLTDCETWRIISQYQQRCVVTIQDTSFVLYNAHPLTPLAQNGFSLHKRDLDSILTRANADIEAGKTVILAGDWNMTPLSDDYEQLTQTFKDAYVEIGQGVGFTYRLQSFRFIKFVGGLPIIRIDYVFYQPPVVALEARVWHENAGSDHMPVFVRLAIP